MAFSDPISADSLESETMIAVRVKAALVDTLYRSVFVGLWSQPSAACLLAAALSASVPKLQLIGWLVCFVAVMAARGLLYLWYKRARPGVEDAERWRRRFLAGAWATGLLWGLAAPLFMPFLSPLEEIYLDVAVVGASAGGLSTLCADRQVVWGYLFGDLVPLGAAFALNHQSVVLVLLTIVYLGALLMVGGHFQRLFARTFHLGFHNELLAERLTQAREVAEKSSRAKSDFLAHMSHELRTPLNAVLGFSQVIEDEVYGPLQVPEYAQYIRLIHRSGLHLLDLISDILDLSKAEAGKLALNEEEVEVRSTIEEAVSLVRDDMQAAGVNLVEQLAQPLPRLRGDRRKLRQICLNLLSNAAKFTPTGGTVQASADTNEQGELVIVVSDTGIGIAPENLARVFAPFEQIDSSLSRRHQGSGLGLPLTKRFVELHGGTVGIDSKLGSGTRVTVRFPAARVIR